MKTNLTSSPILRHLLVPMTDLGRQPAEVREINILRHKAATVTEVCDYVAVEAPLQIEISGKPSTITMRTPGDDIALALGFLFTEGMIRDYAEVATVLQKDENTVNVIPEAGVDISPGAVERNFYSTSSCGVCGKASVEAIAAKSAFMPTKQETIVSDDVLKGLQETLLGVQSTFELTGGLHACALFSPQGRYLYHSEDVGRHNALDKLVGHALMAGRIPLQDNILLLSGRASFELVQKASMAGIPVIAAVGAPSSLAVDLAISNSQTLIGFLKKTGFNIYCGKQRIKT